VFGQRGQETLVAGDGDREPVDPDRPLDPPQHQVMARSNQVDARRHDAVAGVHRRSLAGQELADLLGQPRPRRRAERGISAIGHREEPGREQLLVGDMPERQTDATRCATRTTGINGPEQRTKPETGQPDPAAIECADPELVDQLDLRKGRNAGRSDPA
jgi:hypothetical protein